MKPCSIIVWDWVFLLLIYDVLKLGAWGLSQACLHICPVDSIVGPECWYLLTAWPKRHTTCVCAQIHYSSTSCCVTLVVLSGWLCVIWKESVYLRLDGAECSSECVWSLSWPRAQNHPVSQLKELIEWFVHLVISSETCATMKRLYSVHVIWCFALSV